MSLNAESANGDSNLSNLCSAAVLSFDKDPETPEWAKTLLRIFQGLVSELKGIDKLHTKIDSLVSDVEVQGRVNNG